MNLVSGCMWGQVRELKAVLVSRGVDMRGLMEKADLIRACRDSEPTTQ